MSECSQNRIAHFSKVSFSQFLNDARKLSKDVTEGDASSDETKARQEAFFLACYEAIALPRRATSGSAGYDFYLPYDITVPAGESILIPTGIRAEMEPSYVLMLFPRSGLGFRYRFQLDNTVGVIDSDYAYSDNEGHIMAKLTNDSREAKTLVLSAGSGFMQGIFLPFGITREDAASGVRNGGFGSTS